ncbi:glycosyltransferase [Sphingobacterium shayense]|uniref:glycosyltransferase n=1 Tax=Sphingobacterium shayense TaxID=626343 RepID=UPI001553C826|nr:glycosyltransferase [Sphingobacterium shayense]NQD69139.1 glycosyltransferase [Sphingobacterium shayense]
MVELEQFTPYIPYIPLGILGLLLLVQLYYILFVYGKLAVHKIKSHQENDFKPPISIIISAFNEQDNLRQFLPDILQQEYPEYEVIVVDDCSSDDTKWVLKEFISKYPERLKVIEIKEHIRLKNTKKFTLTMGIKGARYDHLLFTDADCQPINSRWISEMAGAFTKEKEIILGYSPYFKLPGFLNKIIRFETTHTAMSYISYALKRNAYMAVGRNLAYKKSLFFKSKGFTKHMHIKSGDDDLFVNQNATRNNVNLAIHQNAHVYSGPKETWKAYYRQKARHSGASTLYKGRHKRMLAAQLVSALLFYIMIVVCVLIYPSLWYIPVGAYLIRLLGQLIIFNSIYRKLGVHDLLLWLPILDLFYYFYICINGVFNRNKKEIAWK